MMRKVKLTAMVLTIVVIFSSYAPVFAQSTSAADEPRQLEGSELDALLAELSEEDRASFELQLEAIQSGEEDQRVDPSMPDDEGEPEEDEEDPEEDPENPEEDEEEPEEEEIEPYDGEPGALIASSQLMGAYEYEENDPFSLLVDEYVLVMPEEEWDMPEPQGVMGAALQELYDLVQDPEEETDSVMEAARQELHELVREPEEEEPTSVMGAALQELYELMQVPEEEDAPDRVMGAAIQELLAHLEVELEPVEEAENEALGAEFLPDEEYWSYLDAELQEPEYEVKLIDRFIVKYKDSDTGEAREELERISAELFPIALPELEEVVEVEQAEQEEPDELNEQSEDELVELDEQEQEELEENEEAPEAETETPRTRARSARSTVQLSGDQLELMILDEPIAPSELREMLEELDIADEIEYVQPDYALSLDSVELDLEDVVEQDDEEDEPEPELEEEDEPEEGSKEDEEASSKPDEREQDEKDSDENDADDKISSPGDEDDKDDGDNEDEDDDDEDSDDEDEDDEKETKRELGPVVVAVIDTGIDVNHPDLEGYLWLDEDGEMRGWNIVDDNDALFDEEYPLASAHGTHIAGAIADTARKYGADVVILPVKVFENGVAYTSDVIAGIEYAKSMGADIINMSFGSKQDNPALAEALLQTDALMVAAVGNSRRDLEEEPSYPSGYRFDNVLSVASVNADDGYSYYSNYGPSLVDLAARGREVVAALPGGDGDRGLMSGTSMAAAQASAASAVTLAVSGEEMTVPALRERMIGTADRMSHLENKVGEGRRLNLQSAIDGEWSDEILDVEPEDDFDVHGYQPDEGELFELFGGQGIKMVVAVRDFNLAIEDDGSVWGWGTNTLGQCGTGHATPVATFTRVPGLQEAVQVSGGMNHSLALLEDSTVWGWGGNGNGQLGDNTKIQRFIPVQAHGLHEITAIAAGINHSLALKSDGTVWAWGSNSYGQLGNSTTAQSLVPTQVQNLGGVQAISAGDNFSVALKHDGTVWTWGQNNYGQLGEGTITNQLLPVQVTGLDDVQQIAVGIAHVLALKADGTLWSWGSNQGGALGNGNTTNQTSPVQISGEWSEISFLSAGGHSIVVDKDGIVWVWGRNNQGQLGDGTTMGQQTSPMQGTTWSDVLFVTAGLSHTVALKRDGTLWASGENMLGQVNPQNMYLPSPTRFDAYETVRTPVSYSTDYYIFDEDDVLWALGNNRDSALGIGNNVSQLQYVRHSLTQVEQISICGNHTLALRQDGAVWAWGLNSYGQVGNTTTTSPQLNPIHVTSSMKAISTGSDHSLSLHTNGTVYAWGRNNFGQLGNSTTTNRPTPGVVSNLTGVTAISAGRGFSLALKSDGTVWAWGANNVGQVGNNTNTNQLLPVQVSGLTGVSAIAVGDNHSLALQSDGTVWAWGLNTNGQLGDGTTTNRSTPVMVSGLTGVTAIAAGQQSNLALKSDGTVWAWGFNGLCQLGDGTFVDRTIPVQLKELSDVESISTGGYTSFAVKSTGEVFGWGHNYYQPIIEYLGWQVSVPVKIINEDKEYAYTILYYMGDSAEPFHEEVRQAPYSTSIPTEADLTYEGELAEGYNRLGVIRSDSATVITDNPEENVVHIELSREVYPYTLEYYYADAADPFDTVEAEGPYGLPIPLESDLTYEGEVELEAGYGRTGTVRAGSATEITADPADNVVRIELPLNSYPYTLAYYYQGEETPFDTVDREGPYGQVIPDEADLTYSGEIQEGYQREGTIREGSATVIGADPASNVVHIELPALGYTLLYYYGSSDIPFAEVFKPGELGMEIPVTEDLEYTGELLPGFRREGTVRDGSATVLAADAVENVVHIQLPSVPAGSVDGVVQVDGGALHSVLLAEDGTVWTWGSNAMGQCGTGSTGGRATLSQVEGLGEVIEIAAGSYFTLALKEDGSIWAWGNNTSGQLGVDPAETEKSGTPVRVYESVGIVAVAAGTDHGLALDVAGGVWTWGRNQYGQLGDGTTTDSWMPVAAGVDNVVAIGAGDGFSVALKADGSVWSWGKNNVGQLGDNNTANSPVPVHVYQSSGIAAIAVGAEHAMALDINGAIWSWGRNQSGQLGDGGTADSRTPVYTHDSIGYTAVAAGQSHSMALAADGSVWSWGSNTRGQLGTGSTNDSAVPTRTGQLSGMTGIATGSNHSFAWDAESVWGWGDNASGQVSSLHSDTTILSPVEVLMESSGAEARIITVVERYADGSRTEKTSVHAVLHGDPFAYTSSESVEGYALQVVTVSPVLEYTANKRLQTVALANVTEDVTLTLYFAEGYVYVLEYYYEDEDEPFDVLEKLGQLGQTIPSQQELSYSGELEEGYSTTGFVQDGSASEVTENPDANVVRIEYRRLYRYEVHYYKGEITDPLDAEHFIVKAEGTGFAGDEIPVNDRAFAPGAGYKTVGVVSGAEMISPDEPENVAYVLYEETSSLGEAELLLNAAADGRYYVSLKASQVLTFDGYIMTMRYDPAVLRLLNFAVQASEEASGEVGAVEGTTLTIRSHEDGEIVFVSAKEIPEDREWSGLVTLLEFQALVSGETVLELA